MSQNKRVVARCRVNRSDSPLLLKSTLLALYARQVVRALNGQHLHRTAAQLEGASLSVRNNLGEAHSPQSRRDFVHKLKLAQKELLETEGIIVTLSQQDGVSPAAKKTLLALCDEIGKMISASIATTLRRQRSQPAH